ncbi:MAG: glycosyltransferase [Propionibacteriaceae bacterium]|jgi:glycosyltransferase involved in cell wall biosynthesis/LmbE family N-acetylglucosaminyl deacetylase|nr:glycosyltransferase [Propionibacteriaceae bacterium]
MSDALRLAMVSFHTSPLDSLGAGDAGGMNVVERHEALALAALGHTVDLITRRSDPAQPDVVDLAPGVTVRHVTAGPPARLPKSAVDQFIPEFTDALAALADTPQGVPYDLIHSHHWMSGMAALPLARAWGIPHVQSYHSVAALPGANLSEGEPPESPARVPGEALLARESDLVVAISAAEARTVIERCGATPDRVAIVPPGVDSDLFHPANPWQPADPTPLDSLATHHRGFAILAARLQPLKAPDLAVAALAHVPEPIRPDLVIAGEASADFADYTARLDRLIAHLGLDDYVHIIGPQDRPELAWLLRQAAVCLVPSHSETFGLIALEAAASGTPVIAAAAGGLREAVVHGETGQLMDSRQPEDWGMALTKLLSRPGLLARMGTVARVHARRFSWATMAVELTRLYAGLRPAAAPTPRVTPAGPLPPRYLFVHAHPDDETLSTGAAILALRRAGAEPVVVTATRGELGEVTPRVARALGDEPLAARRVAERSQALAALGAVDAGFLGSGANRAAGRPGRRYSDSGMAWVTPTVAGPAPDSPPEALSRAPLDEVVADIAATARHWRAAALVSYDDGGGYGHPDHVRCHHAAAQAARELGLPFYEVADAPEGPDDRGSQVTVAPAGLAEPGQPVVYTVDPADRPRLLAAHRAYASQFTVDAAETGLVHVGGQPAPLVTSVTLRPA